MPGDADVGVFVLFVLFFWCIWTVIGAIAGGYRGRVIEGAGMGFLLGPIGLLLFLCLFRDLRPHCQACKKVLIPGALRCPYCTTTLLTPAVPVPSSSLVSGRTQSLVIRGLCCLFLGLPFILGAIPAAAAGAVGPAFAFFCIALAFFAWFGFALWSFTRERFQESELPKAKR